MTHETRKLLLTGAGIFAGVVGAVALYAAVQPGSAVRGYVSVALDSIPGLPGHSSNSPDAMNGPFRSRLDDLFADLESQGFNPQTLQVWRDQARQDYYFAIGESSVHWSYHMATRPDGSPDALAADTQDGTAIGNDAQAAYYLALRKSAGKYGLQTGGTYSPSNATWAAYSDGMGQLGWDPGHVEPAGFSLDRARAGERPWT